MNLNFIKKDSSYRHIRLMYVGFALFMAVLYDVLFWNKRLGLGFLVFVGIYLIGFFALTLTTNRIHTKWPLALLVPIFILSADVFFYNNELVQHLVPWVVFALLILMSVLVTVRNHDKFKFFFFNIPLIKNVGLSITKWRHISSDLFKWNEGKEKLVSKKIVQGILIALPLLLIFGLLFSAADAVFADWINKIFDFEINDITVWRFVRTVVMTLLMAGFFYVMISEEHLLSNAARSIRKLDSTIMNVVLVLLNAFFALFVFIQITYLFGGKEFVLGNSLTFAEYARKGFFELVAVMVIAAGLLLCAYYSYIHHAVGVGKKLLGGLQIVLLAQVAIIGFSALKRMNLYQQEYGYTVLRLYVEWFIYFLFALVLIGIVSVVIRWSFRNYWYAILVSSLAAFVLVSSLNVDYLIARENVNRALKGDISKLDMEYLRQLSGDVLPGLEPLGKTNFLVQAIGEKWGDTLRSRHKDWREWNKDVIDNLFRLP